MNFIFCKLKNLKKHVNENIDNLSKWTATTLNFYMLRIGKDRISIWFQIPKSHGVRHLSTFQLRGHMG